MKKILPYSINTVKTRLYTGLKVNVDMEKRMEENEDYTYFDEEMWGFTTVTEDNKFYINEAGNPVIVFEKYEVAPGFMGQQEFEIVKS